MKMIFVTLVSNLNFDYFFLGKFHWNICIFKGFKDVGQFCPLVQIGSFSTLVQIECIANVVLKLEVVKPPGVIGFWNSPNINKKRYVIYNEQKLWKIVLEHSPSQSNQAIYFLAILIHIAPLAKRKFFSANVASKSRTREWGLRRDHG